MPVFYNKYFTWLLVAIILYAFFSTQKERNTALDKQADGSKPIIAKNAFDLEMKEFAVKANEKSLKFIEKPTQSIIKKVQDSEYGKVMLQKAAMDSIREQHGDEELHIIYARINSKVKSIEVLTGAGEASACGDTVKVKYDYFASLGKDVPRVKSEKGEQTKTITLGKGEIIKGLEQGISGMKKGARRKIAIPAKNTVLLPEFKKASENNKDFVLGYEVEMLEIIKHLPFSQKDITIVEKIANDRATDFASCGSTVNIKYRAVGKDPKPEDDIKSLSFKIGGGNVPIGLEQGIIEMPVGSTRKIKVPKELMKTVSGINVMDTKTDEDTDFFVELVDVKD